VHPAQAPSRASGARGAHRSGDGLERHENGALLRKAAGEFDVLLTVDSNMEFQQNTAELPLAVIVLIAHKNDVDLLRPLMPQVRELLPAIRALLPVSDRSRGRLTPHLSRAILRTSGPLPP
jgi:hypothetical protein